MPQIYKYTKKAIVSTLVAFSFLLISSGSVKAEQIGSFYTVIDINENGTISVQENIKYDFENLQRHGIFRTIPYTKINQDGDSFKMTFSNIKVTDESGRAYKFVKTDQRTNGVGEYELKIGDADTYVTGVMDYVISYDVAGALTYFSEHDELYWNITGNQWNFPIDSVSALIKLPVDLAEQDITVSCYAGAYGENVDESCSVLVDKNSAEVKVSTLRPLQPGEGLTIAVGFPKGYVQILEPQKDEMSLFAKIMMFMVMAVVFLVTLLWFIVLPLKILIDRTSNRKFLKTHQKILPAWFDPPKENSGEKYKPAEAGMLIDKKPDHKEITATIIHLAQSGYFKIHSIDKVFEFEKTKEFEGDKNLEDFEKLVLEALFKDRTIVDTKALSKDMDFGQELQKFNGLIEKNLENKQLFEKSFLKSRNKNIFLWVASFVFLNLPLMIVLALTHKYYARFNQKGVEKYSEVMSLYNFLVSQDEQLDFQAKNQMFFEKLLPYATAFGVEKIWADRFKDLQFKPSDWYDGNMNSMAQTALISSAINRSVSSSISSYVSSTRSSSGFSSGGGGGGFSGGGGGGGGGGSW